MPPFHSQLRQERRRHPTVVLLRPLVLWFALFGSSTHAASNAPTHLTAPTDHNKAYPWLSHERGAWLLRGERVYSGCLRVMRLRISSLEPLPNNVLRAATERLLAHARNAVSRQAAHPDDDPAGRPTLPAFCSGSDRALIYYLTEILALAISLNLLSEPGAEAYVRRIGLSSYDDWYCYRRLFLDSPASLNQVADCADPVLHRLLQRTMPFYRGPLTTVTR